MQMLFLFSSNSFPPFSNVAVHVLSFNATDLYCCVYYFTVCGRLLRPTQACSCPPPVFNCWHIYHIFICYRLTKTIHYLIQLPFKGTCLYFFCSYVINLFCVHTSLNYHLTCHQPVKLSLVFLEGGFASNKLVFIFWKSLHYTFVF
jgi:hypothetical protein